LKKFSGIANDWTVVENQKYSDQVIEWLCEMGYTHCFFLAGGNIMHLLESASKRMKCIPVVHEVTAGIAVEYFNEVVLDKKNKAFALVTAGPGLTNILTAIAGAYTESRELLVIGGQVKTSDLMTKGLRQRGIQEIDGVKITESITKRSERLLIPQPKHYIQNLIAKGFAPRKGPIFLEIPLDVQGALSVRTEPHLELFEEKLEKSSYSNEVFENISLATRPVLLLGGGVSREFAKLNYERFQKLKIPIMTTWNGADRYGAEESNYWGRPNTWGQRYANILVQQADCIIAVGSRLGLQQTGFNWLEFAPVADVYQVDIDPLELEKGHPVIRQAICDDADNFLHNLLEYLENVNLKTTEWFNFGNLVKNCVPLSEEINKANDDYVNIYDFMLELSQILKPGDVFVPSSSGSSMTVAMQALINKRDVIMVTNKSLASMGYGLGGAIGAATATNSRVILIEGDGGFAQNMQDIGTVVKQNLPIKIFILDNEGYASIRTTQKNYFKGNYLGCDGKTGLGLPNWRPLFEAYGIQVTKINTSHKLTDSDVQSLLNDNQPRAFLVSISPEQTYFPKISSKITKSGSMGSDPLHLMTPKLPQNIAKQVFKYIQLEED
jgi:acetolactate synthase-1/2/3 large subunit